MITTAILNGLLSLINLVLSPLPTGSSLNLSTQATALTTSSLWPHLGWLNDYLPVDQAVTAFTLILSTWGIIYLIRIGLWIWNLLPFGGSN
jgi:hypothetical protein